MERGSIVLRKPRQGCAKASRRIHKTRPCVINSAPDRPLYLH